MHYLRGQSEEEEAFNPWKGRFNFRAIKKTSGFGHMEVSGDSVH